MIKLFHLFDVKNEYINEEILVNIDSVIYIKQHSSFPNYTIIKLKDNTSIVIKENFESVKKIIGDEEKVKSKLLNSLLEAFEIYSENEADSKGLIEKLVEK